MKDYKEQFKSPKWQKKRLEVLNLRGFKCEACEDEEKQLHVHHRFYIKGRQVHEYDNDVLQVLCEDCHKKVHKLSVYEDKYTDLIRLIERHDSIYNEMALDHLVIIMEEICDSESHSGFLDGLSNAFNTGFESKIAWDLRMHSEIEALSIKIDLMINDKN